MGTTIEAVAALTAHSRPMAKSSLHLIDDAARECLARAGRDASELDILLNAGIYHDDNLGEPALAALVQEDVGANPGHPPLGGHGTFSFDVLNGVGGVLTAAYLIDGFLRSGTAETGMVVAGDADPDSGKSHAPFSRSGGAMILGWHPGDGGFARFHLQTFPEFESYFHSEVGWHERNGLGIALTGHGHNYLEVTQEPGFLERSLDCAVAALANFEGGDVEDVDLLIASHTSPEFGDLLADRLELSRHLVVHLPEQLTRTHTAQPIAALELALGDGRLAAARRTLFVAVGAGITVTLAEYLSPAVAGS